MCHILCDDKLMNMDGNFIIHLQNMLFPFPLELFPFPFPSVVQNNSHSMGIPWEWEFPFPSTPLVCSDIVSTLHHFQDVRHAIFLVLPVAIFFIFLLRQLTRDSEGVRGLGGPRNLPDLLNCCYVMAI